MPVPTATLTEWCSPMIVTQKKDGMAWKTDDLQDLKVQCLQVTHHT